MKPVNDHVSRILDQWGRERPDLDASPMAIFGRISRLADALGREISAVQRRFGLGEGEFDVLATLRRSGEPFELSPGDLAATTMVTSGAVSKRVDRLESAGLVTRERCSHDGRARLVRLTPEGRERIDRAVEAHLEGEHRLLGPLSESERAHLAAILQKWAGAVEDE